MAGDPEMILDFNMNLNYLRKALGATTNEELADKLREYAGLIDDVAKAEAALAAELIALAQRRDD